MVEETTNRPVIRFCVDLYRAADFLLLSPILPIIQRRLGDHCDEKLKWLCTRGNKISKTDQTALLWIKDIANGIEQAYKWNTEPIKMILMEFVWVGRGFLLAGGLTGIQNDLDGTPAFIKDMFHHGAMISLSGSSQTWVPNTQRLILRHPRHETCPRCNKKLVKLKSGSPDAHGQIWDPFTVSIDNIILREWCKECSSMNMIPWRES